MNDKAIKIECIECNDTGLVVLAINALNGHQIATAKCRACKGD